MIQLTDTLFWNEAENYVALKADSPNTITVVNGKFTQTFAYDRSTQGSQIELCFKANTAIILK